ncbi:MAG: hypothetical protein ACI9TV_001809 [Sulfurimonas sp.]|jgi:hypothetical protein|uniref:cytochrome C n=1 Tax=Sulfurimonas sp. TaxID=2022749 RepID=UPI0039E4F67C
MKKIILALATCSVMAMASGTTIDATMKLMQQGMDQINTGFMVNSKEDILQGISTLENSNAIFTTVNVADFIKSNKVAVANNVNKNLAKDLKALKKAMGESKYAEATAQYAKVLNNCVACHTIIRGW